VKVRDVEPKLVFSKASAVKVKTAAEQLLVRLIADGEVTLTVGFDKYVVGIVLSFICGLSRF
jgi:hypothetical protein